MMGDVAVDSQLLMVWFELEAGLLFDVYVYVEVLVLFVLDL